MALSATLCTYVEGHKNKVADALSRYYESSSDEDLHYDDFVSADVHIDKLGEDLPLSRIEEAEEMLLLHRFSLRLASASSVIEDRDVEAMILDPADNRSGRSELTLADIVLPEDSLRTVVEENDFLSSIKKGYAKHSAWQGILDNPVQFPKFKVVNGLISKLNDLGDPRLVLPDVIHKGEKGDWDRCPKCA